MREKLRTWWKKSGLKTWTDRLPRLSRGKKLVLNLVLTALAGVWLWGLAGYPLPTAELEFRRLERTGLTGPSEIVFSVPREGWIQAREGTALRFSRTMVVGVDRDRALVGWPSREGSVFDTLESVPLEDGPSLIPLPANYVSWLEVLRDGQSMNSVPHVNYAFLLLRAPRETASGALTVREEAAQGGGLWDGALWDLGDGVWLITLEKDEDRFDSEWYRGARYVLRLYDGAGALLLEREGTVPQLL